MTSLPVLIPVGFEIVVKKGDVVAVNDVLARKTTSSDTSSSRTSPSEISLDLAEELGVNPSKVRSMLRVAPGDGLHKGDVIAERSRTLGLKADKLISELEGTIVRFERSNGILVIAVEGIVSSEKQAEVLDETVLSPLAGTISVCHNDSLVIDSKDDGLIGSKGIGGIGQGEIAILEKKDGSLLGADITAECSGKVLLVQDISREALAKANAVDVAGIIALHVADEDLEYMVIKRLSVPVIEVSEPIMKKIKKDKSISVTLHGEMKTITL